MTTPSIRTAAFALIAAAWLGACVGDPDAAPDDVAVVELAASASCAGRPDGKKCDDGLFCTVDDRCHAGACIGTERSCEEAIGFCSVGTCDEAHDTCATAPREPGCVDRCDTPKLASFYRKGWRRGHDSVTKAWDHRAGDCRRVDGFADEVAEGLVDAGRIADPDARAREHRRCRAAGVVDGGYAALAGIQDRCDQICFLDGDLVGRVAAATYCELAIGADGPLDVAEWVRGPLDVCGLGYELACDGTFIGVSTEYRNDVAACAPFTTGVYEQPWDRTRDRSCDYRAGATGSGLSAWARR